MNRPPIHPPLYGWNIELFSFLYYQIYTRFIILLRSSHAATWADPHERRWFLYGVSNFGADRKTRFLLMNHLPAPVSLRVSLSFVKAYLCGVVCVLVVRSGTITIPMLRRVSIFGLIQDYSHSGHQLSLPIILFLKILSTSVRALYKPRGYGYISGASLLQEPE